MSLITFSLLIFLSTFIFGLATTLFAIYIGQKFNVVDRPNKRKVHKHPIPRTGGISIYLSLITITTFYLIFNDMNIFNEKVFLFLLCASLIFILGFFDDVIDIKARYKFLIQFLISFIFATKVYTVPVLYGLPFVESGLDLGLLSIPFTMCWILFIMNAFNLIDGLDGLLTGISSISSFTLFFISMTNNSFDSGFLLLTLGSALLAFLLFNKNPAKIFLGDSGSLFIGFVLATITLIDLKQATASSLLVPMILFLIPSLDAIFAIVRRIVNKKPIFSPDKKHLHHMLLDSGFSQKGAVRLIYLASYALSAYSIMSFNILGANLFILYTPIFFLFVFLFFLIKKHSLEK